MDVGTLIDAIVRQTTVLIAQLATAGGERTPLSHTANQVFLDLSRELREQGLGSKVVADMFGMALRTYQTKVRRLSESRTERGRSLWEAVLDHIQQHACDTPISRSTLLQRFRHDDPIALRSVLRDQVESGLVSRTGRGDATRYQLATPPAPGEGPQTGDGLDPMVWMMVHRLGPASASQLVETLSAPADQVAASLQRLLQDGRIRSADDRESAYVSDGCVLPLRSEAGWEAALFDHFQAMVAAMCHKLELGQRGARPTDLIGGSTFSFRVWPAHPYYEEATRFLQEFRAAGTALRKKIAAYNETHTMPEAHGTQVVIYAGQNTLGADDSQTEAEEDHED